MSLRRKRSWIKIVSLSGVGLLLSGVTSMESAQSRLPKAKAAHGVHLEGRFDAAFHGVVEEISFSDAASF